MSQQKKQDRVSLNWTSFYLTSLLLQIIGDIKISLDVVNYKFNSLTLVTVNFAGH